MLRLFTEALSAYITARLSGLPEKPIASFSIPGAIPGENALSFFLYAITEDSELRSSEKKFELIDNEWVSTQPPLRLMCTYIVSVWPNTSDQNESILIQQDILSAAYRLFTLTATLPAAYMPEPMKKPNLPKPVISLGEEGLPDSHEFWASIGCPYRLSFTFTATVSLPQPEESYDHVVEGLQIDYKVGS
jgi:hypothetical protein